MDGLELMWFVFELLPLVFALDLVLFHAVGDQPLAVHWWWRRHGNA